MNQVQVLNAIDTETKKRLIGWVSWSQPIQTIFKSPPAIVKLVKILAFNPLFGCSSKVDKGGPPRCGKRRERVLVWSRVELVSQQPQKLGSHLSAISRGSYRYRFVEACFRYQRKGWNRFCDAWRAESGKYLSLSLPLVFANTFVVV